MEKNSTLYSNVLSVATPSKETSRSGIDPVVDITDNATHPGDNVIKNILNFSKALKIIPPGEKSQIGAIEIMIN